MDGREVEVASEREMDECGWKSIDQAVEIQSEGEVGEGR